MTMLKPPRNLTISQWADEERYLSSEFSAEPGKWITSRAEYGRGIMDAGSDPTIPEIVIMKAVQVGYSEILANTVGFFICEDPSPMMIIQPNIDMAEAWSKERLTPMIRDTPAIAARVTEAKSRDSGNTIRAKKYPGGQLSIVGSNAPAGLASRPIRVVLGDEIDKYPVSAGVEGNPISLAIKRTQTFWNRKIILGSTPTVKGRSEVEARYLNSDQRRYFVPCPDCGHEQTLRWENVKWDKGRPESAMMMCEFLRQPLERRPARRRGQARQMGGHQTFQWRRRLPHSGLPESVGCPGRRGQRVPGKAPRPRAVQDVGQHGPGGDVGRGCREARHRRLRQSPRALQPAQPA